MNSPHWFGFEGSQGLYCRNHGGACWAKLDRANPKKWVNSKECPQPFGWIRNPILRFLFGWI